MARKGGMTKKQKRVFDFIEDWLAANPYPPTVREIGEGLHLSSPSTVQVHLNNLEKNGFIRRVGSKSRSIEVIAKSTRRVDDPVRKQSKEKPKRRDVVDLPLVGRVAAGEPILAEQNIEDSLPMPINVVGDAASFMLKVRGDSMIDAGILDGDYVVVREQSTADNGDIVVAMIDDSATVKAFYREKDRIRLQPYNEHMEPIYTRDASVLGKVVALFRTI